MEKKELSLPVEGFNGVNRNVSREDVQPTELYAAKNLWERTLGELETRWNSVAVNDNLPSNIIGIDNIHTLYKGDGTKKRIAAVHCQTDVAVSSTFPAGLSVEFVNDANGYWNKNLTTWGGTGGYVAIRLIGYGLDKVYYVLTTSVAGYSAATAQKLRVTVASDLGENVTGFEVYTGVKTGSTATRSVPMNTSSSYVEQGLWCAFQELVSARTGTFDFLYTPVGQRAASAADFGGTIASFRAVASETGGSLIGGKTYYVCVLDQTARIGLPGQFTRYSISASIDIDGATPFVVPVTIPGTGTTGSISIDDIETSGGSNIIANTAIFFIGEDPRTLVAHGIFNEFDGDNDDYLIEDYPRYSPARLNLVAVTGNQWTLTFALSHFSLKDMFIGIEDNGDIYPIFVTGLHFTLDATPGLFGDIICPDASWWTPGGRIEASLCDFIRGDIETWTHFGDQSKYSFQQRNDILFLTTDFNWYEKDFTFTTNYCESYGLTDGNVCAVVPLEYESSKAGSLYMPPVRYIKFFDSSICLAGGQPVVISSGRLNSASDQQVVNPKKVLFFSQANNPYNFKDPSGSQLQFIQVGEDSEGINGLALFTNTTVDTGPVTQLAISKRNSTYLTSQLGSAVVAISSKVGFVNHNVLVNTPVGLFGVAHDNVYLLREEGEPIPMGQQISPILKRGDMSKASACYHDRHLKISFYDPDEAGTPGYNNVEWWLNLNKAIEKKGGADWVGPMVGSNIAYSFVEDLELDGPSYDDARDRFCIDQKNIVIFKADVEPAGSDTQCFDFANPIETSIVTKDFDISPQDNNWNKLLKRTYWKIRTNKVSGSPMQCTQQTYIDGALAESQTVNFFANASADFDQQPLKTNRVFPTQRLRGRTIKKVLTTTDRIAISGFQINYEVERRRM